MLNQLVESKSNLQENKSRGGFLLTTFVLVVGLCLSAVLYSLFAKDLGTGIEELELSRLVAPIAENAPPALLQKREMAEQSNKTKSALPSRQANILRIEESPLDPKEISVVPNTQKSRPNGNFLTADTLETNGFRGSPFGTANGGEDQSGGGIGIDESSDAPIVAVKKTEPPPFKKAVEEKKPNPPAIVRSSGVVNGKAKFLPKPIYTAAAKSVKAAGDVNVQVMIDENGTVISAKALDGHPLLRAEAEKAARNAKFNPTLLSEQPVKVSGVIVYKFSIQ